MHASACLSFALSLEVIIILQILYKYNNKNNMLVCFVCKPVVKYVTNS